MHCILHTFEYCSSDKPAPSDHHRYNAVTFTKHLVRGPQIFSLPVHYHTEDTFGDQPNHTHEGTH